eukprot:TRINITY_DN14137_c0_g2_i1.p1 TRINITY_DN14137_c0_g2~~TRINITY_DN14137_c0_g2_i1.p1  ORF type:complete len:656 (-),score=72.35 TRINITY_DN14137_c0_g2_i1:215-2182(-)
MDVAVAGAQERGAGRRRRCLTVLVTAAGVAFTLSVSLLSALRAVTCPDCPVQLRAVDVYVAPAAVGGSRAASAFAVASADTHGYSTSSAIASTSLDRSFETTATTTEPIGTTSQAANLEAKLRINFTGMSRDAAGLAESFLTQLSQPWFGNESADVTAVTRSSVTSLIQEYVASHRKRNKSYQGSYALAKLSCPRLFGNRVHEYLAMLAFAVVANIPFADDGAGCDAILHRNAWTFVSKKAARRPPAKSILDALPAEKPSNLEERLACIGELEPTSAGNVRLEIRINGHQERYEAQEIGALSFSRSSRAQRLFALGVHFALGSLFNAALAFTENITSPVLQALRDRGLLKGESTLDASGREMWQRASSGTLWLGVHVRHRSVAHRGLESIDVFRDAIRKTLASRRSWTSCAVLLASDRRKTVRALAKIAKSERCVPVVLPRLPPERNPYYEEQGEDTGQAALLDLFLLSLADVLIASFGSTFTLLAQELIAARYDATTDAFAPGVVMCDYIVGTCLPERPLVIARRSEQWYLSLLQWPRADLRTYHSFNCDKFPENVDDPLSPQEKLPAARAEDFEQVVRALQNDLRTTEPRARADPAPGRVGRQLSPEEEYHQIVATATTTESPDGKESTLFALLRSWLRSLGLFSGSVNSRSG